MKLQRFAFAGIVPKLDPRDLPDNHAQAASNCKLWNGKLQPWRGVGTAITDGTDAPLTLYRFGQNDPANSDTQFWWTLPWVAHIARGPIYDDDNETTYFTYLNGTTYYQRVTDKTKAGSAATPSSWSMKVPKPTIKPVTSVIGTEGTADKEERVYFYSYVNSKGFESQLSPASDTFTMKQDATNYTTYYAQITVEKPPSDAEYRMNSSGAEILIYCGAHEGVALLVGVIKNTNGTWSAESGVTDLVDQGTSLRVNDKVLASARGDACPSADWEDPPDDLHNLRAMPNGILVGISKNNICFCDPYHTQAWPLTHRHAVEYQPLAIGVFGNTAVIATNGLPYTISGTEPVAMVPQKIERNQAIVSVRSMVELGGGVAYASPDGLCVVDSTGLNVVSQKQYSRDEWQALNPSSIHACAWDGRYVMACDPDKNGTWNVGIIWDFDIGPTTFDVGVGECRAFYVDLKSDTLYFASELGRVYRFDYDESNKLIYTWRDRVYALPSYTNFGAFRIHAASYSNLTVKIFGDNTLVHTQVVTSSAPFRLPSGFRCREWQVEISGTDKVLDYQMSTTIEELLDG